MDKVRAKHLAKEYAGQSLCGWQVDDYINCGKSALVCKAHFGDKEAAIKIFDPELIEKFGKESQFERINREKSLIGKKHPCLVEIYDGGYSKEKDLYFVVMEYLHGRNLAEVLTDIPTGTERSIISQIASAAKFLEDLEICHRDIKPENINVSADFQHVKLLDLGVIRPLKCKSITEGLRGKNFIGTHRYSPPEFILCEEQNTLEGWCAITFYQLGAVLHDLIMRRPLFTDYESSIIRLGNAIQHEKPVIESRSVTPALVELCRHCLLKTPATRLELVKWSDFEKEPSNYMDVSELKSRIAKHLIAKRSDQSNKIKSTLLKKETSHKLDEYSGDLQAICRLECVDNKNIVPPIEIQKLSGDINTRHFAVKFEPCKTTGLAYHLRLELVVRWIDTDSDAVAVLVAAMISKKPLNSKLPLASNLLTIYRGIYTRDTVGRNVTRALYYALNSAQEIEETTGKQKMKDDDAEHYLLDLEEISI